MSRRPRVLKNKKVLHHSTTGVFGHEPFVKRPYFPFRPAGLAKLWTAAEFRPDPLLPLRDEFKNYNINVRTCLEHVPFIYDSKYVPYKGIEINKLQIHNVNKSQSGRTGRMSPSGMKNALKQLIETCLKVSIVPRMLQ